MSNRVFPPGHQCSCLIQNCDWLHHGCSETRDQECLQCPSLLDHYRDQHIITPATAWRPNNFSFRVPQHHPGSPSLGAWSPSLSPSLHTPGLAWWLQGVTTESGITLTMKIADLGLPGPKPHWLQMKPKSFSATNQEGRGKG